MSHDNKTLADVLPGGRVRLGDQMPPLPASSAHCPATGEPLFSAAKMKLYAQATLSAQPSPGGHGELVMPACKPRAMADDLPGYYESDRDWMTDRENAIALGWFIDNSAAIRSALAARQPVGQERVAWASTGATGHKVVAMPGLHKLPYGDYDLYAAPPAQAVDLGQLPRAVELLSNVSRTLVDWAADEQREAIGIVKAVTESQAVGNG
ncbi:hypothetical protein JY419_00730 [Stenotrophomonas maltophilia]|nr:hypothetical protein [Stenotrophomonas maltophilia]